MLGAHFDSWHTGTGATDNAAGSAVMLEALRMLKATGSSHAARFASALWTGEEEGLLGSRAYVKEHFGDPRDDAAEAGAAKLPATSTSTTAPARFVASICRATKRSRRSSSRGWSRSKTASQDGRREQHGRHGPPVIRCRRASGLPVHSGSSRVRLADAPLEHGSLRAPDPGRHDAATRSMVAAFVYLTANRDEKLPRKPAPKPQPAQQRNRSTQ